MSSKFITNIIIVVVALVLLGGGYYYLTNTTVVNTGTDASAQAVIEGQGEAADVLRLLRQVETITLDGKILSNQAFNQVLVNFTTDLPQKPRGRGNPFAPFGVSNFSVQTQTAAPLAAPQAVGSTTPKVIPATPTAPLR